MQAGIEEENVQTYPDNDAQNQSANSNDYYAMEIVDECQQQGFGK